MTPQKRKAMLANGYAEFRVSVPGRPDLPELTLLAPTAAVAAQKYADLAGRPVPAGVAVVVTPTGAKE